MGEVDIARLHPIYRECIRLTKENNWPFVFKEDSGDYETMIEFVINPVGVRPIHPPMSTDWDAMKRIESIPICPDIMDYRKKIVLEFEEESTAGKSSGKLGKKGHWAESKRDSRRDNLYKQTKFRFCKIWESELKGPWKLKLFHFLADCYCNRDTTDYTDIYLTENDLKKLLKYR